MNGIKGPAWTGGMTIRTGAPQQPQRPRVYEVEAPEPPKPPVVKKP